MNKFIQQQSCHKTIHKVGCPEMLVEVVHACLSMQTFQMTPKGHSGHP